MVLKIEHNTNLCIECGGAIISIPERGEKVCGICGLVADERLLDTSRGGIRAFTQQDREKRQQNGDPISILTPNIALSTVIDKKSLKNPDLKRAAKWNSHLKWESRNLITAITEMKRIGSHLNFSIHVKDSIVGLYKEVYKKGLVKGRSIKGMISACAYYICKEENIPITFQDIVNEAAVDANVVKRCYKILIQKLKLRTPKIDPYLLIPRYCTALNLGIDIERATVRLLKNHESRNIFSGKDPKGICAGAIYLVTKLKNRKVNQKEISMIIGITEVTLRSRYKELIGALNFFQ